MSVGVGAWEPLVESLALALGCPSVAVALGVGLLCVGGCEAGDEAPGPLGLALVGSDEAVPPDAGVVGAPPLLAGTPPGK